MTRATDGQLLATVDGRQTRARIDAAVTEFFPQRDDHVRQVTLVVLRARSTQKNNRRPGPASPEATVRNGR